MLHSLMVYLVGAAEAHAQQPTASSERVLKFWLQHLLKVVRHHPGAATGCWPEMVASGALLFAHAAQ